MKQPSKGMTNESDRIAACKKIHARACHYRGTFLNSVAVIEKEIALILTDYFCTADEEKRKLFFSDIITTPTFSLKAKKEVLVKIVKKDYPHYWKDNDATLKNLDDIISFRNKLAHSVIDVSDEALARDPEHGVGFIEWKEATPITETDFQCWKVKANMVVSCLADIKRLLPFKQI